MFVVLHIVVNFELKFLVKRPNTSSCMAGIYVALNRDHLRAVLKKVMNVRVLEDRLVSLSVSGKIILITFEDDGIIRIQVT